MSELTPDKELDAVHQIIISPQCSSSYITKLPIRLARPLCERLQLPLDSSGTRGSIKADYIAALKEYTRNKHGPLEHGKGKRKAGELGEDEDGSNKTKRKKDTHSGMTTTLNSTPEILPSVTTTASTKRPASPGDGESQEDSRIIKRMRLPGGPLLKLVRSKAPSADRIPTHSITRRSHKVTGAARPRKPESSQDTVRRDTSDKALSFTIRLFAEADEWDHTREMVFQPPTNGDVNLWEIARLLRVEGCLLVIDPHNGRPFHGHQPHIIEHEDLEELLASGYLRVVQTRQCHYCTKAKFALGNPVGSM